ncbi:hypothetical protein GpartN1_g4783.t1 [Galdieria partita]|uniref:Uncharacterized protein n=1 Tax=Galdieria partita TaxID=83374 RepID=A0A9C7Q008_9RHOD|nr:hypothetical protein GpartN1_g4783.t1 [Galdieria partita]
MYHSSSSTQQDDGWQQEKENMNPLPTSTLPKKYSSHSEKKKYAHSSSRSPLSDITELVVGPQMKLNNQQYFPPTCSNETVRSFYPKKQSKQTKEKHILSLR